MDKEDVVNIYNGIKRNEIGSFVEMRMDLESPMEWNQKEKNRSYINT